MALSVGNANAIWRSSREIGGKRNKPGGKLFLRSFHIDHTGLRADIRAGIRGTANTSSTVAIVRSSKYQSHLFFFISLYRRCAKKRLTKNPINPTARKMIVNGLCRRQ